MGKVTWNDLHEATQHELRDVYGFGDGRQGDKKLEQEIRRHLDGADATERREIYQKFYGRR